MRRYHVALLSQYFPDETFQGFCGEAMLAFSHDVVDDWLREFEDTSLGLLVFLTLRGATGLCGT